MTKSRVTSIISLLACLLALCMGRQLTPGDVWDPSNCTSHCVCHKSYIDDLSIILNTVDCADRDLMTVDSIPINTEALILTGNSIDIETMLQYNDTSSQEIHTNTSNLSTIQYLSLSNNQLKLHQLNSLHHLFTRLLSLRALDLSNNNLESLEPALFTGIKSLESLSLSGNSIVHIERNTFQALSNLKTLKLNRNSLQVIDSQWFGDVRVSLRSLDISNNKVGAISSSDLRYVKCVERLNLSDNNLTELTASENDQEESALEDLNLSSNLLSKVPTDFLALHHGLALLTLDNNPIMNLSGDNPIAHMYNLRHISISYMPRLRIVGRDSFLNLTNLIRLEMYENRQLIYVDAEFSSLTPNMSILYLHNNALVGLSEHVSNYLPNLVELSLYNNKLHCGCFLEWLWRKQRVGSRPPHLIDGDKIVCESPHAVKSSTLYQLTENQITNDCLPQISLISEPHVEAQLESHIILHCEAIGAVNLYWMYPHHTNRTTLIGKQTTYLPKQSVNIDSHGNEGVYTCLATSSDGIVNSVSVYVRVVHPRIQLTTIVIAKSLIALKWDEISGSKIITYSADDGLAEEAEIKEGITQYILEDLKPNSDYIVCLLYHMRTEKTCITVHMLQNNRGRAQGQKVNNTTGSTFNKKVQLNNYSLLVILTVLCVVAMLIVSLVLYRRFRSGSQAKVLYMKQDNVECCSMQSDVSKFDQCYNPTTQPLCDNYMT